MVQAVNTDHSRGSNLNGCWVRRYPIGSKGWDAVLVGVSHWSLDQNDDTMGAARRARVAYGQVVDLRAAFGSSTWGVWQWVEFYLRVEENLWTVWGM